MKNTPAINEAPHEKFRRRRSRRLLIHFLLFTIMGILLLASGVRGRKLLHEIADNPQSTTRQQVIAYKLDSAIEDMRVAVLNRAGISPDDKDKTKLKVITNLVSSSFRGKLEEMITGTDSVEDIAVYIVDTMTSRATQRLTGKDETTVSLKESVSSLLEESRSDLLIEATMMVDGARESITSMEGVRVSLKNINPKPDQFFFIYYSIILLVVGAICLTIGCFTGIVHFRPDRFGSQPVRNSEGKEMPRHDQN